MQDLIDFIKARLDEDASIAAEAGRVNPSWQYREMPEEDAGSIKVDYVLDIDRDVIGANHIGDDDDDPLVPAEAEHIARHDPARVLAEMAAKRAIVEKAELHADAQYPDFDGGYSSGMDDAVALLAMAYSSHPDYRAEWQA